MIDVIYLSVHVQYCTYMLVGTTSSSSQCFYVCMYVRMDNAVFVQLS